MSLVSIIIPIYNAEKFLHRCIRSVLNQSYKEIELILINDGSTDDSEKIAKEFAAKDERVRLISQKNSGPSVARNKGISVSEGKYICFLDADDFIEKEMIYTLVKYINSGVDLVISGYNKIIVENKDDIIIDEVDYYHLINMSFDDFLRKFSFLFRDFYINSVWNKLYLGRIIKNNKLKFKTFTNWGEDLIFNLEYLDRCNEISIINNKLYNYITYNKESITNNYNKNKYYNSKFMYNEIRKFLLNNEAYETNKKIVEKKYFMSVLSYLSESYLNNENINEEIKDIFNDYYISNNIDLYNLNTKQAKIVRFFIKHNLKILLKIFLNSKLLLSRNDEIFNFFKKIN